MNMNKVILAGRLTRDPEVRYTPKGTAVTTIGLAVSRKWKTDSGDGEETTFVDCEAFGRTAEVVGEYLRKGSAALIAGRLRLDSWEDKNTGQKRSKLGVVVEEIQFGGSKSDDGPRPGTRTTTQPSQDTDELPADDDSVPF